MTRITKTAVVLLLAAIAGCTGKSEGARDALRDQTLATIQVRNNNWQDINVFAVRNGSRHRLGMVTTNTTKEFRLPAVLAATGELRLLVDIIGSSSTWLTQEIHVSSGDRLQFRVQNHLALSHFMIATR